MRDLGGSDRVSDDTESKGRVPKRGYFTEFLRVGHPNDPYSCYWNRLGTGTQFTSDFCVRIFRTGKVE